MLRFMPTILLAAVIALPVQAASWSVVESESRIGFTAEQGGSPFSGTFTDYEAAIVFDPANLSESTVTVSIRTASAATGDATKDSAMPGADWFASSEHPDAVFEASTFQETGEGSYEAEGTLTLRGESRPLALPFTLAIDGNQARAEGSVTFDMTEFGVGTTSNARSAAVANDVTVTFEIVAESAS